MDRHLLYGSIFLLILEVFILLGEMGVIPFKLISFEDPIHQEKSIGTITETKQNVRRRSNNSIFWENSRKKDTVFNYDSILTLDNSSSEINLEGNIKLQLHENTLVVLEPQNESSSGALKIRFEKGDLRSANSKKFKLGSGEWIIEAQNNTDLSIKSTTENKLEIEVFKGQIIANNSLTKQIETASSNQRVSLEKKSAIIKNISTDLSFNEKPYQRIYSHTFPVPFKLTWIGHASAIRILSPQKSDQKIQITNQNSFELALDPGSYYFSLESDKAISKSVGIHVWPAPKIYYYTPLPRDRIITNQSTTFAWSEIDEAVSYEVRLSDGKSFPSVNHVSSLKISTEGPLDWFVYAKDDAGFIIPPTYGYPLFSTPDPLDAPELSEPRLREPANQEYLPLPDEQGLLEKIFNLFIPMAHAQIKGHYRGDILFEWKPVPGADSYNIEISSSPDFINPDVIARTDSSKFVWQNYKQDVYYWRVAGGQKSGRMGLFSKVQKLDLKNLSNLKTSTVSPGVKLLEASLSNPIQQEKAPLAVAKSKPVKLPKKQKYSEPAIAAPVTPVNTPAEISNENTPAKEATEAHAEFRKISFKFGYGLYYNFTQFRNEQNVIANFKGLQPFNFSFDADIPIESGNLIITGTYSYEQWKPDPESKYPFQPELASQNFSGLVGYRKLLSPWTFGAKIQKSSYPNRDALEVLGFENIYYYGASAEYFLAQSIFGLSSTHQVCLLFGSNSQFQSNNNLIIPFHLLSSMNTNLIYKLNLDFYFGNKDNSGFKGQTGLFLELDF